MLSRLWSELRFRLRTVFRRDAVERELDDELRFHLERETDKYLARGYSGEESRRLAALAFGGLNRTKDDTRDAHGTAAIDELAQDLRYAIRGLHARPLFAAVVALTLGLGVGVNAAMFSVIDQLMFRPPEFLADPGRVNRVFIDWTGPDGKRGPTEGLEYRRYQHFIQWSRTASAIAGFAYRDLAVGEGDAARILIVGAVSAEYFDFFNAPPAIGRLFTRQEDALPAGTPVAVLAFSFWQSHYAGRNEVLGQSIKIGRTTYKIIGVAARGFAGVSDGRTPVAFVPITAYAAGQNASFYKNFNWRWMNAIVRRKPGVTIDALNADLTHAFRLSWDAEREMVPKLPSADVVKPAAIAAPLPLARGPAAGPEAKVLTWVIGVAALVLAIACANVANLLLGRSLRRRRELAVRRALGGSRARLVRQLLTESAVLAALGGIAGVLGAQLASRALTKLFIPAAEPLNLLGDMRTLIYAATLTAIAALLAGLVPALHSGHDDLAGSLRGGMRDGAYRGARARRALLILQTSLSVILLVGAGLFLRSVRNVRATRLGFDVDAIVHVAPNLRGVTLTGSETVQLGDRLLAEARVIPGVEHATLTVSVPFWSFEGQRIFVPGIDSVAKLGRFLLQAGSPEYFATTGTRLLRGRAFSNDDRVGSPRVAVISDAMAKALWKSDEAIGKCFRVSADTMPCTTVIGIAENVRAQEITDAAEYAYYLPIAQYYVAVGTNLPDLYARVHGHADDYAEALRSRLQRVMPGAAYVTATPMHELVDPSMRSWTSGATMFSALGTLALVLAAVGLYAVVAFGVAQRLHELGVRVALGALPGDVVRLVVFEGVRVTLIGVAIGGAIAYVAARGIEPLLFGVTAHDPVVFGGVAAVLIVVGAAASIIPAARAGRVDPNIALRAD